MTMPVHQHAPDSRHSASLHAEVSSQPDQAHVVQHQAELTEQIPEMNSVPVLLSVPEGVVFSAMSLATSGVRQLMPQDPFRQRAVVLSIDQDVVLCQTKEQAQAAANIGSSATSPPIGFYLSKGVTLELKNQSLVYVANSSSSNATRVSLMVERNENPDTLSVG